MPLRDQFHPPISRYVPWESFHSAWPTYMAELLLPRLPNRYYALPKTHIGAPFEVDIGSFEKDAVATDDNGNGAEHASDGGVATMTAAPPRILTVTMPAEDLVELQIRDAERDGQLVAVVELVSPSNKDRPASRLSFTIKCASYLNQGVSVIVVDVVTLRHANLHADLLELLQAEAGTVHDLSASSYRLEQSKDGTRLHVWHEALEIGRPLPTMPLWLTPKLSVPLELEQSYEKTWRLFAAAMRT